MNVTEVLNECNPRTAAGYFGFLGLVTFMAMESCGMKFQIIM
jgi:hypothetical protein